jgi:hypothetical protein
MQLCKTVFSPLACLFHFAPSVVFTVHLLGCIENRVDMSRQATNVLNLVAKWPTNSTK